MWIPALDIKSCEFTEDSDHHSFLSFVVAELLIRALAAKTVFKSSQQFEETKKLILLSADASNSRYDQLPIDQPKIDMALPKPTVW